MQQDVSAHEKCQNAYLKQLGLEDTVHVSTSINLDSLVVSVEIRDHFGPVESGLGYLRRVISQQHP